MSLPDLPDLPSCSAQAMSKPLHIALTSGNFGARNFFTQAFARLA